MSFALPGESIIAAGVSGGLNYLGAREANEANKRLAREQMDFQERMSNTSHQRSVEDMRKAGLNPALAYNLGGASSPAGASTKVENELAGAASSALEARRMYAELENIKKTGELLSEQAKGQALSNASQALSLPEKEFQAAIATAKTGALEVVKHVGTSILNSSKSYFSGEKRPSVPMPSWVPSPVQSNKYSNPKGW